MTMVTATCHPRTGCLVSDANWIIRNDFAGFEQQIEWAHRTDSLRTVSVIATVSEVPMTWHRSKGTHVVATLACGIHTCDITVYDVAHLRRALGDAKGAIDCHQCEETIGLAQGRGSKITQITKGSAFVAPPVCCDRDTFRYSDLDAELSLYTWWGCETCECAVLPSTDGTARAVATCERHCPKAHPSSDPLVIDGNPHSICALCVTPL